jgi:hypothetical protein
VLDPPHLGCCTPAIAVAPLPPPLLLLLLRHLRPPPLRLPHHLHCWQAASLYLGLLLLLLAVTLMQTLQACAEHKQQHTTAQQVQIAQGDG